MKPMLVLLDALAFGSFLIPQTASVDPCSDCAVEQPDAPALPRKLEGCNSTSCALPAPAPEGLACITNGCAVDQPDESQHAALQPIILACLGNDC
jgi:hypothetical protein